MNPMKLPAVPFPAAAVTNPCAPATVHACRLLVIVRHRTDRWIPAWMDLPTMHWFYWIPAFAEMTPIVDVPACKPRSFLP